MNYCCLKCFWFQSLLAVYNVVPEILFSCVKNFRGCRELYPNILGYDRMGKSSMKPRPHLRGL